MKIKTITRIITSIAIIVLIIMSSTYIYAGVLPSDINGSGRLARLDFIDNITNFVKWIGTFIAVGALMVIGIKYVTGSIEEKANYKKSMMPYLIGCFILFGASMLVPKFKDLFTSYSDKESFANSVLGFIQLLGTLVSVGALMIIGIKYMLGSAEQRASYKKSLLPYFIGSILIFGAVNLTSVIYKSVIYTQIEKSDAIEEAEDFVEELYARYPEPRSDDDIQNIKRELQSELSRAEAQYHEEAREFGATSEEASKALQYMLYIQGELGKFL